MSLDSLLTWACIWLGFDALSDVLCIGLCLGCFAVVKSILAKSK